MLLGLWNLDSGLCTYHNSAAQQNEPATPAIDEVPSDQIRGVSCVTGTNYVTYGGSVLKM